MDKQTKLTQKEAVKRALEELGGRARLRDIYPRVIPYIKYKPESNIKATLRRLLQTTPKLFRHTEGKRGFWELVSYKEQLAKKDKRMNEIANAHITKEVIINAFNECDNLAERCDAKLTMQILFGDIEVWKDAYKEMKNAGYFKDEQPQIIINNPHFDSLYTVGGNKVVKISK